jgi:DNA-binding transcriptional regulator LsrR (DeoR family)
MEQIAAEMKLSRSSVSRLIAHAREIGLVEITVHSPQEATSVVARRLSERYGISVHVVSTPPRSTDAERLERTARTAAHVLSTTLDPRRASASPGARRCRRSPATCPPSGCTNRRSCR